MLSIDFFNVVASLTFAGFILECGIAGFEKQSRRNIMYVRQFNL